MTDTNKIKKLAKLATPGPWVVDAQQIGAIFNIETESGDLCIAMSQENPAPTKLEMNEQRKVNAEFIAAANPRAILGLIAEIERLRGEIDTYEEGMRSLACNLGSGGYNSDTLTPAQLVDKVKWGVDNLAETQGRLMDEVRAENTELRKTAERYRKLRKITPRQFKKIQESATTDGGDVFYFHADRFDAGLDAAPEGAKQ